MDLQAQQHLKDCLFHGDCKHISDPIWYLYSTPGTSYLQLMVATHKAEGEIQEIWDKVRVRATVKTDPGEGTPKLEQQIAKLMATLTQAGKGHGPSSLPSSPGERGHRWGCNGDSTPTHPNSHNGRVGPGQMTPAHSLPTGHGAGSTGNGGNGQGGQWPSAREEGLANHWDPNSLQCFRCLGWGHMARECPTQCQL